MFESLERAMARKQTGYSYDTPIITTVDDIRRVVASLDPNNRNKTNEVNVQTEMVGSNQDNGAAKFNVSAKMTSYNQRDMLIRALGSYVNKQTKISEVANRSVEELIVGGKKASQCHMVDTRLPIDDVIAREFGGRRIGSDICWDLSDGYTYKYDVFNHKLTRVKSGAADTH